PDEQIYYARSNLFDQPLPRVSQRLQILSPFDNFIIQRARLHSLFNFDYQIECYVPAPKRRYGYFALPLLYKDQFVGRIDCKAFRDQRRLALQRVHLECAKADTQAVCTALAAALPNFATFQACDQVNVHEVWPRPATKILKTAVAKHF
ncbi:MAG: crosslink repair DNA glycosylase YcaQ family protein, partial [Pseudomonadota bacterium]